MTTKYFDSAASGMVVQTKSPQLVINGLNGNVERASVSATTLDGIYFIHDNKKFYLTDYRESNDLEGKNALWVNFTINSGWDVLDGVVRSKEDTHTLIKKIIKNNARIYENNLLCARFVNRLNPDEKKQVAVLQLRLDTRNRHIEEDKSLDVSDLGYPAGYSNYQPMLNSLVMSMGEIITAIVIGVVVLSALSAAAYYAYQFYYEQSLRDVKFSDDLTKKLTEKLTKEEYAQLKTETAGLVTKGVLMQKFKTYGSLAIKVVTAVAGGFIALKYLGQKNK